MDTSRAGNEQRSYSCTIRALYVTHGTDLSKYLLFRHGHSHIECGKHRCLICVIDNQQCFSPNHHPRHRHPLHCHSQPPSTAYNHGTHTNGNMACHVTCCNDHQNCRRRQRSPQNGRKWPHSQTTPSTYERTQVATHWGEKTPDNDEVMTRTHNEATTTHATTAMRAQDHPSIPLPFSIPLPCNIPSSLHHPSTCSLSRWWILPKCKIHIFKVLLEGLAVFEPYLFLNLWCKIHTCAWYLQALASFVNCFTYS